jgi:hypothetical protein
MKRLEHAIGWSHRFNWPKFPVRIDSDLALLVGWSAISGAAALTNGYYSSSAISLVLLGTFVLFALAMMRPRKQPMAGQHMDFGFAVAAVTFTALALPSGLYGSGFDFYCAHTLTALAAISLAVVFVFSIRVPRVFVYVVIAVQLIAGCLLVIANPDPLIDVWNALQAAANGLGHDRNMYNMQWFALPGQDSNAFPYFPGCVVFLWPFYLIFRDVRYGELFAFASTALILMRSRRGQSGVLIGCLAVLYPGALFGIQSAWIDPILLLEVSAAAWACTRGRKGLAMLAFGAALASKPQVWLLLPLAAVWKDFGWRRTAITFGGSVVFMLPWYLASPSGFVNGVLLSPIRHSNGLASLSLYTTLALHDWHIAVGGTVLATVVALGLAMWRGQRDTRGFLLSSALVMAIFNLTNSDSFFNEWWLTAGLVLAAIAFSESTVSDPSGAFVSKVDQSQTHVPAVS